MAITRRGILAGTAGMIAASAVDAVSSESARMARAQTAQPDVSTSDLERGRWYTDRAQVSRRDARTGRIRHWC